MQLDPAESAKAMKYSVGSLGAGFIGLDFAGDLRRIERHALPKGQTDYWDFATRWTSVTEFSLSCRQSHHYDRRSFGGFNRSSQHAITGVGDDKNRKAAVESFNAGGAVLAGSTAGRAT